MPSSGSSDSTTSDADSGLSDVEELLDAVGQALTASDYQQSPTREQEASDESAENALRSQQRLRAQFIEAPEE